MAAGTLALGGFKKLEELAELRANDELKPKGPFGDDKPNGGVDLLIVGSAPQTATGQVRVSAAAAYMIELIRCPVIVLPRGVALTLG